MPPRPESSTPSKGDGGNGPTTPKSRVASAPSSRASSRATRTPYASSPDTEAKRALLRKAVGKYRRSPWAASRLDRFGQPLVKRDQGNGLGPGSYNVSSPPVKLQTRSPVFSSNVPRFEEKKKKDVPSEPNYKTLDEGERYWGGKGKKGAVNMYRKSDRFAPTPFMTAMSAQTTTMNDLEYDVAEKGSIQEQLRDAKGKRGADRGGSASFISSSRRDDMSKGGTSSSLGPGAYNVKRTTFGTKSSRPHASFQSKSSRFSGRRRPNESLYASSLNASDDATRRTRSKGVTFSAQDRFDDKQFETGAGSLGPGSYITQEIVADRSNEIKFVP